jgi:flagellar basal-body rod protein FlgB
MFSSPILQNLQQSLDTSALKQKTITNNIANIDTPNYKSKEVVFKDELKMHLEAYRKDSRHFEFSTNALSKPVVRTNHRTSYSHNGNNVNIDKEMAEMAKNQIHYQALIQRLNGKFNSMKTVVKGGR